MRRVTKEGSKCTLEFHTTTATPNAVRRALMNDVETYAPDEIVIHENTSSQTDEYIAHRIGLIPFVQKDETKLELTLNVSGRVVMTTDLVGDGFKAMHDTPIIRLCDNQILHITIRFAKGTSAMHAKHSLIGPVAYKMSNGVTTLSFETLTDRCPLDYALSALDSLLKRVDDSTYIVETQYDDTRKIV